MVMGKIVNRDDDIEKLCNGCKKEPKKNNVRKKLLLSPLFVHNIKAVTSKACKQD